MSTAGGDDAHFDVVVIGAGVVGTAIARALSHHELSVALLEAGVDVGAGTSKANTAILHTGFDAKPGTLEAAPRRAGTRCSARTRPRRRSPSSGPARCSLRGPTSSTNGFRRSPSRPRPTATTAASS